MHLKIFLNVSNFEGDPIDYMNIQKSRDFANFWGHFDEFSSQL